MHPRRRYASGVYLSFPAELLITAILVLLYAAPPTNAQVIPCPAPLFVVTQDLFLEDHLNKFPGCNLMNGDLRFGYQNCSTSCDITGFSLLSAITTFNGSLSVQCCNVLADIDGFTSLQEILGSLVVYYNRGITTISGFQALRDVRGSVTLAQNPQLSTITGFSQLSRIRFYLSLQYNPLLDDLSGFSQLTTLGGEEVLAGHALSIIYNTNLRSLRGLAGVTDVSYGTVHIEGNIALCYAGYPLWEAGSYPLRADEEDPGVDKGIDWRTKLSLGTEVWQFTWGVAGEGYPTLLIQNNAPVGSCGAATCHTSCPANAGCLGPNEPALCGSCDLIGTFDPCATEPAPPGTNIGLIVGVVVGVVMVVIVGVVLVVLGVLLCTKCSNKWKERRMGSFDINVQGLESTGFSSRQRNSSILAENSKPSDLIASYSLPSEEVVVGGYIRSNQNIEEDHTPSSINRTRKISAEDAIDYETTHPGPSSSRHARGNRQSSSTEKLLSGGQSVSRSSQRRSIQDEGSGLVGMGEGEARRERVSATRETGVEDATKKHRVSLTKEPSVEDIMKKLREENGEVPMNFPPEQVKLGKEMGQGDFGKVLQAEAKKLLPGQRKTQVVVKQLKRGATSKEKETFFRPVQAMRMLQHPNVLSLMGVVSEGPSLLVMLEYCSLGNFKTYLVTKRNDVSLMKRNGQILKLTEDMALGLQYLHTKNIAHNDFAVRSCLVTGEGRVKLGDYGITRQTFKEDYYSRSPTQKAWPIRWMAPEQVIVEGRTFLDSEPVSMQANIWSFGVSLWEVCSFAQWPYDEMSNEEVIQMGIASGKCFLENPLDADDSIAYLFSICELCWQEPALRPTMEEIVAMLKDPSRCKRKKRTSSLRRQNVIVSPTSRSQTLPRNISPPSKDSSVDSRNANTLTRNGQPRPRRAAPAKPAPGKPGSAPGQSGALQYAPAKTEPDHSKQDPTRAAPSKPGPVRSAPIIKPGLDPGTQQPQSGLTKPGLAKPSRPAPVMPPQRVTSNPNSSVPLNNDHTIPQNDKRLRNGVKSNKDVNTISPAPPPPPPPEEIQRMKPSYDIAPSSLMAETEFISDHEEDEDIIIEPPASFSESSLDDLDDPPSPPVAKKQNNLPRANKFQPPPDAVSDNDDQDTDTSKLNPTSGDGGRIKVEEKVRVKKVKKKKRVSKDYSSNREEEKVGKQKKKRKKKIPSAHNMMMYQNEGAELPEYDQDRGLDRIPVTTKNNALSSNRGSLVETKRGDDNYYFSGSQSQDNRGYYSSEDRLSLEIEARRSGTSYHNVSASEDFTPPWLEDDNEGVEVNDGPPSVVYDDEVAALVW